MVEPKIRLSWDSCVYWSYVCLMSGTVGFLQSYITPRVIPAWKSGSRLAEDEVFKGTDSTLNQAGFYYNT